MNETESNLLKRAVAILQSLIAEPTALDSRWRCPVQKFAKNFLQLDPASDLTCAELFEFYEEVVATGKIEPISRSQFLRYLPGVIEVTFGAKKCHAIKREGRSARGFKGIDIRREACPVCSFVVGDLPIEPEWLPEPNLDPVPMTTPPAVTEIWADAPRI